MIRQDLKKEYAEVLKKLPDSPGVYFFRQKSGGILYIGKATSVRDRVRSYFSGDMMATRGPKIVKMLEDFDEVDFQSTDSVLEAMILEANLIKRYQPPYNTAQKDNKSFTYVVVTKEDYPRIMLARGRDLEFSAFAEAEGEGLGYKVAYTFGPFPQGSSIREGLVLVRKIFPFRDDKCTPCIAQLKEKSKVEKVAAGADPQSLCRPCFNRQIGLCPGVCTGEISREEYRKTVKNIVEFFRGNKKGVIRNLEKEMTECAKLREFEKAGKIKRQIFALNHIRDISLIKAENVTEKDGLIFRVEAYDVAHFGGKDVVGVMTVVENGAAQKAEYRKFKIKDDPGNNDTKALREILRRRFNHDEWRLPNLIVVDGGVAQKNAAESVLENLQVHIPVMAVTKNEYHKPKAILGDRQLLVHESAMLLANAEAHRYGIGYHRSKREGKF